MQPTASPHCPKCGAELASPEAECANCLLELGFASIVSNEAEPDSENTSAARVFGDYELLDEIARGGMGVVYRARQRRLGRTVALKLILGGQLATREFVHRFRAEAAAAAALQHPNIVAIHEVGIHEGNHFFSMDYVEGQNLAQLVGNRPLPAQKAAHYLKLIAEAIHYAHEQGILHRDLKPSNVLVDAATDQPRVTDFGLAKRLDGESSLTLTGQVLGSPHFMPPEQADARRGKVSRRSDVYALGGILYFLLTARPPFQGDSLETTLGQVLNVEPVSPRLLNPTVPRDLETICLKCLNKEPGRRYPTAQAIGDDLGRFLNDEPILARPTTRLERTWRWCRRKPAFAGLLATAAVLLLTLAIGSPIVALRIQRAQKVAETERERAKQEAASRRVQLYAAEVNLAGETLAEDDLNRARELLAKQIPVPGETNDLRGFEWRYLWQQSQSAELTTLGQHDAPVHGVRFSPDGTLLASSEINGTVKLWDHRTRKYIATLRDTTIPPIEGKELLAAKALAFAPDGNRLAVGVGRSIVLWEVASHQRIAVLNGHSERVNVLAFARGGKILASGADDDLLKLWDITSAELREIATLPVGFDITSVVFSNDGKTLAASGCALPIKRWDLSNPEGPVELTPLEATSGHTGWVLAIAFSPRTNLFVSGGSGGQLMVGHMGKDAKEFLPHDLTRAHGSIGGIVNAVTFTPDGQTILSAGSDNNITLWDLSGQERPIKLKGHVREVFSIDVSPDGRTLASGGDDRTVKLWDISSRWREKPKMSHGEWMMAVAISRDSKFIASLSPKKLRLWDAATEEPRAEHPRPQAGDGHLVFSPESNILAAEDNGTGTIRLLKVPSFEEITNFRGRCPLFSPNGAELVYFLRDDERFGIHWRDLKTQEERVWKTEWDVRCLAISPDGRSIAAAKEGGRSVWTWNANAPDHPVEIEAPAEDEKLSNQLVWDVAFSPDGHWLASASWDGRVRLWNLDNPHEKIQPLKAHSGAAWAVAFSPDGRTLATGGDDATIKLWNLASLQQTATLRGHTGPVDGLAFSRDGTLLASSSGDGTARLWRAPSFKEIADREARLGRWR